jgi:hypothetical protein
MDQRVRVNKDGTLYLVGLSEQPIVQEKSMACSITRPISF